MKINGREYPLWSQFVERKDEWIGGILEDFGDSMDRAMGMENAKTEITDICLKPNGKKAAFFEIIGKDFGCGFSTEVGGLTGGEKGYITFSGYGGHEWRIKKNTPLHADKQGRLSGVNDAD